MKSSLLQLRVARKNKLGYAIGIISLTIGFAVCLLVSRFLLAEKSYDTSHKGAENIYRLTFHTQLDGVELGDAVVQFPLANQLQSDYSGIESTLRIYRNETFPLMQYETTKFVEEKLLFVDPNFFSFFAFPLIRGDSRSVLSQSNSAVLTQRAASKYFGLADPMGKTILYEGKQPLVVTGIVDENGIRSHVDFDVIVPLSFQMNAWRTEGRTKETEESWFLTAPWTYLKFQDTKSKEIVESNLVPFATKYFPEAYKSICSLQLQPVTQIHTTSHFDTEIGPNTSDTYLRIFLYIIGAILLFSAINFINLNTSVLLNRAKEFSVKGILGSSRLSLFLEIFTSTLSIAVIALLLAIGAAVLMQHQFNTLVEVNLDTISASSDWYLLLIMLAFSVVTSLIGSIQPFLVLISGTQLNAINDKKGVSAAVRKFAIGAQIACSFILVFGTLVIFKQIGFLMNFNLGFNKENIIELPARQSVIDHYEAFKNEITKLPKVINTTWTTDAPGKGGAINYRFVPEGTDPNKPFLIPFAQVDYDFVETLGIGMKDGREFDPSLPGDSGRTYIVNQAFIQDVGWEGDYLGKQIQMYTPGEQHLGYSGKVIGSFEDFHMESLHFPVKPLIIALRHAWGKQGSFLVKVEAADQETISGIEQVWKSFESEWPFEYQLLDAELSRLYENENKLFLLTMILSVLAILISFFGLFGINSVSILKKYKAIAIKNVLGAHSGTIFREVMKSEFIYLSIVMVIAAPCGYLLIKSWLNEFQFRTNVSILDLLQTIVLITSLVFATLVYHLFKMARTNPLKHITRQ